MNRLLVVLTTIIVFCCGLASMGAVTLSDQVVQKLDGTTAYSFTVTMSSLGLSAALDNDINGEIIGIITEPMVAVGTTTGPTDNYDMKLYMTGNGTGTYDLAVGTLQNRDTANIEFARPVVGTYFNVFGIGGSKILVENNSVNNARVRVKIITRGSEKGFWNW